MSSIENPVGSTKADRPPLRVMLLTSSLHYGGAERQVVELAKHLDRTRFEPMVCCLDGTRTLFDLTSSPTPLFLEKRRGRFDLTIVLRVAKLLKRNRVDLVHCFLFDAEIIGRLAAKLAGTRAVVGSERNSDHPRRPIKDRINRLTKPLVDLVIANSRAGKRYACGYLGFSEDRVAVVHNGVDTDRFTLRPAPEMRKRVGLDGGGHVVGMFASFKAQKNHEMYVRAAQRILTRFPKTRFLCVGHTPVNDKHAEAYLASLKAMIIELSIHKSVDILTDRSDVNELYNACDLTVLSSRREGTPNVVLESLASGVPVVATDVADNALIIPDGVVGHVVALDDIAAMSDRVCEMLANPDRLAEMGREARQHVLHEYTLRDCADRNAALYEQTFARKTGATTTQAIS